MFHCNLSSPRYSDLPRSVKDNESVEHDHLLLSRKELSVFVSNQAHLTLCSKRCSSTLSTFLDSMSIAVGCYSIFLGEMTYCKEASGGGLQWSTILRHCFATCSRKPSWSCLDISWHVADVWANVGAGLAYDCQMQTHDRRFGAQNERKLFALEWKFCWESE